MAIVDIALQQESVTPIHLQMPKHHQRWDLPDNLAICGADSEALQNEC